MQDFLVKQPQVRDQINLQAVLQWLVRDTTNDYELLEFRKQEKTGTPDVVAPLTRPWVVFLLDEAVLINVYNTKLYQSADGTAVSLPPVQSVIANVYRALSDLRDKNLVCGHGALYVTTYREVGCTSRIQHRGSPSAMEYIHVLPLSLEHSQQLAVRYFETWRSQSAELVLYKGLMRIYVATVGGWPRNILSLAQTLRTLGKPDLKSVGEFSVWLERVFETTLDELALSPRMHVCSVPLVCAALLNLELPLAYEALLTRGAETARVPLIELLGSGIVQSQQTERSLGSTSARILIPQFIFNIWACNKATEGRHEPSWPLIKALSNVFLYQAKLLPDAFELMILHLLEVHYRALTLLCRDEGLQAVLVSQGRVQRAADGSYSTSLYAMMSSGTSAPRVSAIYQDSLIPLGRGVTVLQIPKRSSIASCMQLHHATAAIYLASFESTTFPGCDQIMWWFDMDSTPHVVFFESKYSLSDTGQLATSEVFNKLRICLAHARDIRKPV